MRIALINNGKGHPERLLNLLQGNAISVLPYSEALTACDSSFDLIVLSGSSHLSVEYSQKELQYERELIRDTTTPLIGICLGAELLASAYGGTLRDTGHKEIGIYTISVQVPDPLFGGREAFDVYEAHRWSIDTLPEHLVVLASSAQGPEVIRHRTKPQYGFQFHPEKMCDETYGDELLRSLLTSFA